VVAALGVVEGVGQYASERWVRVLSSLDSVSRLDHDALSPGCASDRRVRFGNVGTLNDDGKVGICVSSVSSSHDSATSTVAFPCRFVLPRANSARASATETVTFDRVKDLLRSPNVYSGLRSPVRSRNCISSEPDAASTSFSFAKSILNDLRSKQPLAPYNDR
jgi:hypothetical protein